MTYYCQHNICYFTIRYKIKNNNDDDIIIIYYYYNILSSK